MMPGSSSRLWIVGSEVVSRVCSFVLFALLAQRLDAAGLGVFSIVAASAATGQAVAPALVGKPLANLLDPGHRRDAAPAALSLSILVGMATLLALVAVGLGIGATRDDFFGTVELTLYACGIGVAATLVLEAGFWVRVFTQHARAAGLWRAGVNAAHLLSVALASAVVTDLRLVPLAYLLLMMCALASCIGLPRLRVRSGVRWLTGEWHRWLPYLTGNGSGLVLAQMLPLLLTLVAGLSAAGTFRAAEILFGGANLVSSVLSLTLLTSTGAVRRRSMAGYLVLSIGVTAANAVVIALLPDALLELAVGPAVPLVQSSLWVLSVQRVALTATALLGAALVVLIPARTAGLLQTLGAVVCGLAVALGGLMFGIVGAFAALAAAEVLQGLIYLVVFGRHSPRSA